MHCRIKACIGLGTVDLMFSWQTGVIKLLEGTEVRSDQFGVFWFDFFQNIFIDAYCARASIVKKISATERSGR